MLLVVDIGNSHTVTGMYRDEELVGQWRFKSDAKSTPDELAVQYHTLFRMSGLEHRNIKGIVIASVVPSLQTAWYRFCTRYFSAGLEQEVMVVDVENLRGMIEVALQNPGEVGADRLVNGIAALSVNLCNQIVIDFGTAITFDCITAKRQYLGGAILPGIAISLEALANKTAKLPHIDVSDNPSTMIGKSTVHAMKSGILYGYGAMIDGLVQGLRKEMTEDPAAPFTTVATGGMAELIAPFASTIDTIDPLLTLRGLRVIHSGFRR
jgi:type III pantothenate kinase